MQRAVAVVVAEIDANFEVHAFWILKQNILFVLDFDVFPSYNLALCFVHWFTNHLSH